MQIVVRAAFGEDVSALVHLNGAVQDLHAGLYPDDFKRTTKPSELREFFTGVLIKDGNTVGIGYDGLLPAGYVWFEMQSRPETPFVRARRRIHIHHIAVAANARRRGIGSALMDFVERRAAAEAAEEIVLSVWTANLGAQLFFASRGFSSFTIALRKPLAPAC